MDISTRSENHENEDLLDSWKVKVEIYESPANLNLPEEFLAFPACLIFGKIYPADNLRPQNVIVPNIS